MNWRDSWQHAVRLGTHLAAESKQQPQQPEPPAGTTPPSTVVADLRAPAPTVSEAVRPVSSKQAIVSKEERAKRKDYIDLTFCRGYWHETTFLDTWAKRKVRTICPDGTIEVCNNTHIQRDSTINKYTKMKWKM